MNGKLKAQVDYIYNLCDYLDQYGIGASQTVRKGVSSRTVLQYDLSRFLVYLSAADGKVVQQEIDCIKDYLDVDFYSYVEENKINIYVPDEEYIEDVPVSLQILVMADNVLYEEGSPESIGNTCADMLIDLYDQLGRELMACDNDISDLEIENIISYNSMLNAYLFRNSKSYQYNIVDTKAEQEMSVFADNNTIRGLLAEMDSFVGMPELKSTVKQLVSKIQIRNVRAERGFKQNRMYLNMIFSGPCGTGKSKVARHLANLYYQLDVLPSNTVLEISGKELDENSPGKSVIRLQKDLNRAMGGILLIDELNDEEFRSSRYGSEEIKILIQTMEKKADQMAVVLCGDDHSMEQLLELYPELVKYFPTVLHFNNYNSEELTELFVDMCGEIGYQVDENCKLAVHIYFSKCIESNIILNAHDVRDFCEKTMMNQEIRLSGEEDPTDETLMTLTEEDVANLIKPF